MSNPYRNLPDYAFWRRAVASVSRHGFDPVTAVPFQIAAADKIATVGSCFAQYISRTLAEEGFTYLVTEKGPVSAGATNENYGVFPARFGNVYTVRQLLQLFQRAYDLFEPHQRFWRRADGAFLDPFRPRIQENGFSTVDGLDADRDAHLAATREMFELCDVFIFTLGLTECWMSSDDGAVYPIAPGVVGAVSENSIFKNFTTAEISADLEAFVKRLRTVNPKVRIVLTVSPVPLVATYEPQHVLLSTLYSKSVLRAVAGEIASALDGVAYFPSYEMIVGPQAGSRYFAEDLREVTPEGVAHVMSVFKKHYLIGDPKNRDETGLLEAADEWSEDRDRFEREYQLICDEEALDD